MSDDREMTAVAERPRELSVVEVKAQVAKVHALMKDLMQDGTHYGKSFPGDDKKNLLKPGADKLCFMFRLRPDFTQDIKELSNGHMEVLTRCQIYHIESGNKIAEGVGIASTMESKYRWRNAARKCPVCEKESIIKGKEEYGGGWLCFAKRGGCGAKFKDGDPAIENQAQGKVENADIADVYNTVLKISKKRAYVDATITACAASDIFTQDIEDLQPDENGNGKTAGDLAKDAAGSGQAKKQGQTKKPNDVLAKLKREVWELIKQVPEDMRDYWLDACKNADKETLEEIHTQLTERLAETASLGDEPPTAPASKQRTTQTKKQPEESELPIY